MKNTLLSLIALVALPLASFAGQPSGGTTTPTIGFGGTAIPGGAQSTSFVITKPGSYYLAGDRSMTADVSGIVVNVPDVTIDLNGCTLSFTGGSTANGIEIPATSNVEIRNGSINDAPGDAIQAGSGSILRVNDVHVTNAGKAGLYSSAGLIAVDRSDFSNCGTDGIDLSNPTSMSLVKNTTALNNARTGISINGSRGSEVSGCKAQNNQFSGIMLLGVGGLISNNVVYNNNTLKLVNQAGIAVGSYSTVRNNVVTGNGIHGIYVTSSGCCVEGNTISITVNGANSVNLGNAVTFNYGGGLLVNNRITPSTNTLAGSFTNGGGNILY